MAIKTQIILASKIRLHNIKFLLFPAKRDKGNFCNLNYYQLCIKLKNIIFKTYALCYCSYTFFITRCVFYLPTHTLTCEINCILSVYYTFQSKKMILCYFFFINQKILFQILFHICSACTYSHVYIKNSYIKRTLIVNLIQFSRKIGFSKHIHFSRCFKNFLSLYWIF